jgi:hypothetical protein
MKTLEQILEYKSEGCIDGRDMTRLADFVPVADWPKIGVEAKEGADLSGFRVAELTEANVKERLTGDLDFAFEKALNKRGISASLMWSVVKMWLWVLDDPLADSEDYAQYGLPLFKAVAVKYGLPNPIGDDRGDESRYESD